MNSVVEESQLFLLMTTSSIYFTVCRFNQVVIMDLKPFDSFFSKVNFIKTLRSAYLANLQLFTILTKAQKRRTLLTHGTENLFALDFNFYRKQLLRKNWKSFSSPSHKTLRAHFSDKFLSFLWTGAWWWWWCSCYYECECPMWWLWPWWPLRGWK